MAMEMGGERRVVVMRPSRESQSLQWGQKLQAQTQKSRCHETQAPTQPLAERVSGCAREFEEGDEDGGDEINY